MILAFTEEEVAEACIAVKRTGNQTLAAKELGLSRSALQRRLYQATEKGLDETVPRKAAFGRKIKGVSTLYDADNNVKATWVRESLEPSTEDTIEIIKEAFANLQPSPILDSGPSDVAEELLSVYPIVDVHHGMLSWGEETGEDYDIKIGTKRLGDSFKTLISQSPRSETALILNLGDYFHTNDATNATPAHRHLLDVDSRYAKMILTGVQLMVDIINMTLQKHKKVIVKNIPGNHDLDSSVSLSVALYYHYLNNDRVTVDIGPSEWFFYRFGKNLIGGNHGHRAKPQEMVFKMANDRAKDWGETKYRWMLSGHIHHTTAKEIGGVLCETFQTLAAKDAYAANSGYLAGNSISSITLHVERGEIGRHKVNI